MRIAHIFLVLAFTFPSCCGAQGAKIDWLGDLNYLASELPKKHVNLFAVLTEKDFNASIDSLRKTMEKRSDIGVTVEMMRIVTSVGDGHTAMIPDTKNYRFLPLSFHWFPDGVYVVAAGPAHESAFGAKVLRVGSMQTDEILSGLRKILSHDNESQFKNMAANLFGTVELLVGIGAINDGNEIELELIKNDKPITMKCRSHGVDEISRIQWTKRTGATPIYQQKGQLDHWNDWLADSHTLYFKYNRCQNRAAFDKLVAGTAGFIQKNDVQNFVLDLRDNPGGDSSIFPPLLKLVKGNKNLNQKNRLFVIIGRRTFSSAVLNAMDMKQTNATFVGEPTGGRPTHFGEVKTMTLPSSKLQVSFSTKYFRTIKDADPDSLVPDVMIEMTVDDWLAGRDPVLEKALELSGSR